MQPSAVTQAPTFSSEDARALLVRLYSIHGDAVPLPSERDQNFAVTSEDGEHYVLKISNPDEDVDLLACQNAAMMHVHHWLHAQDAGRPGAPESAPFCPQPLSTPDGDRIATMDDADDVTYFVRLLTYLPGAPLAGVKPHSAELLTSLGRLLGRLDVALADFDHPGIHRTCHWDLRQAGAVVQGNLHRLSDAQQRTIAPILDHFRAHTEPKLTALRTGVIHGDANDYNVMVQPAGQWGLEVAGVIDFGDMVHSYVVGEPAIAAAYAMLGKRDLLAAAAQVVAGYHAANPLSEAEIAVIYDLMRMRLAMSVCIAAEQMAHAPDNDYLAISQAPIWELLARLETIHPDCAHYLFRDACGLTPVPHSPAVVAWLAGKQGQFHGVVDADLTGDDQFVVDLSMGSLLLPGDAAGMAPEAFTELLFGRMAAAGARTAIGRYDEPRAIYSTPEFEVESDELPERRTVHMGIDIFQAAGSPVYAPLAGTVHSFADNVAPRDYGPAIILAHETGDGASFYTLYGHLSRKSLAGLAPGMEIAAGQQIATLGDERVNGGWPPHLHFQTVMDLLGETGTFPGVAAPSRRQVRRSISPDPNVILNIPESSFPAAGRDSDAILAAREAHLGKSLSVSYDRPLKIVRGWREFLYDEAGRAYLDGVNNVCHVGHAHPRVVAAGAAQMGVLNTNTRYLHDNIIDYAEQLLARLPAPLSVVFFVCSGSEANELALRMARTYTGCRDIIMIDGAYHGNTQALVDISPYKHNGRGGAGAPDWAHAAMMPDPYRGRYKGYGREMGERYAGHVKEIVARLAAEERAPAAFIAESVLGCGGQIVLPDGYLAAAFEHVRAAGGVCIADEVQVGLGRVGSHFWGFETQGVVPDIVTMGKPIGNGHPMAAVVTTRAIADAFANGMEYFNTFGGNPVSCAIGQAVLNVIDDERLQENAQMVGERLLAGLRGLMERHPLVGHVRGLGLFVGVELVLDRETLQPAPDHASHIANRMREHGIFISTDGPLHNVLKLKPPMVFTVEDADRLVATLDKVLGEDRLQIVG